MTQLITTGSQATGQSGLQNLASGVTQTTTSAGSSTTGTAAGTVSQLDGSAAVTSGAGTSGTAGSASPAVSDTTGAVTQATGTVVDDASAATGSTGVVADGTAGLTSGSGAAAGVTGQDAGGAVTSSGTESAAGSILSATTLTSTTVVDGASAASGVAASGGSAQLGLTAVAASPSVAATGTSAAAAGQDPAELQVASGGTLELSPSTGLDAATVVTFEGTGGTLVLDGTGTGTPALGGIAGFSPGDVIDVRGAAGVTAASQASGTLALKAGTTTALSLPLIGSFYPGALVVSADGAGGVDVGFATGGTTGGTGASVGLQLGTGGTAASLSLGLGGAAASVSVGADRGGNVSVDAGPTRASVPATAGSAAILSTFNSGSGSAGSASSGGSSAAAAVASTSAASSGSSYVIALDTSHASQAASTFVMQTRQSGQAPTNESLTGATTSLPDGTGMLDASGSAEMVTHLYGAGLDRAPDMAGLQYWSGQLDSGAVAPVDVANSFAASPEFKAIYGTSSNADYVSQLYQNVLGRTGDAAGEQYWTTQLQAGASRGQVLLGFAQSAENAQHMLGTTGDANEAEAYRLYGAALGRAPDATGLSYWTGVLEQGTTPQQVAQSFLNSPEFSAKYSGLNDNDFISSLYQNVLGRTPDAAGAQYWAGVLNGGASHAAVVLGFADSTEDRVATAQATHANWVLLKAS